MEFAKRKAADSEEFAKRGSDRQTSVIEDLVRSGSKPTIRQMQEVVFEGYAFDNPEKDKIEEVARHLAFCISKGGNIFKGLGSDSDTPYSVFEYFKLGPMKTFFKNDTCELCSLLVLLENFTADRASDFLDKRSSHKDLFVKYVHVWFYAVKDPERLKLWAEEFDYDNQCDNLYNVKAAILTMPSEMCFF